MKKFNLAGSVLGAGGVLVLGFQAIAALMHTDNFWNDLSLSTATALDLDRYINMVPFESLQNGLVYLVRDLPLYQLLVASGVICFIIASFSRR
jgi:hypothetical protein